MLNDSQKIEKISEAKGLAKWFSVEITLKIFGQVIWHWVFPPQD